MSNDDRDRRPRPAPPDRIAPEGDAQPSAATQGGLWNRLLRGISPGRAPAPADDEQARRPPDPRSPDVARGAGQPPAPAARPPAPGGTPRNDAPAGRAEPGARGAAIPSQTQAATRPSEPAGPPKALPRETATESDDRLVAMVSHEIRTSLNGVIGMLDLLDRTSLTAEQQELTDGARASTEQMRGLVNDLLDLSKVRAGKFTYEEATFNGRSTIASIILPYQACAKAKGLKFRVTWDLPDFALIGDPLRINQVIGNLLDNALKYTATGSIEVIVRCVPGTALDDWQGSADHYELWVSVTDTGVGLSPEQIRRMFEPYAQAAGSTSRKFGGSGLGLWLSRQLCEGMGGRISAAQAPGGGSVFTFYVRCRAAAGPVPAFIDTQPADVDAQNPLSGRHALVVDDNRINRTLLERWLKDEGMRVSLAEDGADALAQVRQTPFDVVLMDVSMPVMDGIQATSAIRRLATTADPRTRRFATMPIIGVSARAMAGDQAICTEAGMNDYVTKPVDRKRLLGQLRAILGAPEA